MKEIKTKAESYYEEHLQEHGFNPKGMGWRDETAQLRRFEQLQKLILKDDFTVNDLGCGSGDFLPFLSERFQKFTYCGYDLLESMISYAKNKYTSFKNASFRHIETIYEMKPAEYTIASGIFSLKYDATTENWLDYILSTIRQMDDCSTKGLAFNMLTKYSDPPKMLDHLYYADPLYIFDYCKTNISKNVTLLHDYDEFDFTILVRK